MTITPEQLLQNIARRREEVSALAALWASNDLPPIKPGQFKTWLDLNPFATVVFAVEQTARKFLRLNGVMDSNYAVRFCSSVANTQRRIHARAAKFGSSGPRHTPPPPQHPHSFKDQSGPHGRA